MGPGRAILGLDKSDLAADRREEGFQMRGEAVMSGMRLGKGFQPNMGLDKENFGLGLWDLRKLE